MIKYLISFVSMGSMLGAIHSLGSQNQIIIGHGGPFPVLKRHKYPFGSCRSENLGRQHGDPGPVGH